MFIVSYKLYDSDFLLKKLKKSVKVNYFSFLLIKVIIIFLNLSKVCLTFLIFAFNKYLEWTRHDETLHVNKDWYMGHIHSPMPTHTHKKWIQRQNISIAWTILIATSSKHTIAKIVSTQIRGPFSGRFSGCRL